MTQQELEKRIRGAAVTRSRRRTISIEVDRSGMLKIKAPYFTPNMEILRFVRKNLNWIAKQLDRAEKRAKADENTVPLGDGEIKTLMKEALAVIPPRAEQLAGLMGVTFGRITIRCQKTRWGSCSSKGNISLNCLLMLVPEKTRDYVIVHELAHTREMNHSARFWSIVEEMVPDHREHRKWLRTEGEAVISRVRQKGA